MNVGYFTQQVPGCDPVPMMPEVLVNGKTIKDDVSKPRHKTTVPKESYELRILQSLRRIIRAIDIHSSRLAQQHNITGPQLGCLMVIAQSGPLASRKLAEEVYLSPSTVVGIVDRLERKGLVLRERDTRDRRLVHLSITPAGEKLIADTPSLLQDTLAKALLELPELEQVSITMALERLTELMEARHIEAAPILETGKLNAE